MRSTKRKTHSSNRTKASQSYEQANEDTEELNKKIAIIEDGLPYTDLMLLCRNRLGALNFISKYYESKDMEEVGHPERGSLYMAYWFRQYDDSESIGKTILMIPFMMFGVAGSSTKVFSFTTSHRFQRGELRGFFLCRTFTDFFQRMFGLAMIASIAAIVIIAMYIIITQNLTLEIGLYLLFFIAATAILRFLSSPKFSFGFPKQLKKISRGYFYLADFKKVPEDS